MLSIVLTYDPLSSKVADRFDDAVRALAATLEPADAVIILAEDAGEALRARVAEMTCGLPCQVVPLEHLPTASGQRLDVALEVAKTPYVMVLESSDRLDPVALAGLRGRLTGSEADLAVLETGWWVADPSCVLPRSDAYVAQDLVKRLDPALLESLCPDPFRCVLARGAWVGRQAVLQKAASEDALYRAILAASTTPLFQPGPVLLRGVQTADPAPVFEAVAAELASLPRDRQPAHLAKRLAWLDEAVLRTPADQCGDVLDALMAFRTSVPRKTFRALCDWKGSSGRLANALYSQRRKGAEQAYLREALAEQARQTRALVQAFGNLRRSVDHALPEPAYLRALYDRIRST